MDFKQLLERYRNGDLNGEQRAAFEKLLHDPDRESELRELMDASFNELSPVNAQETQAYIYERIKSQHIRQPASKQKRGLLYSLPVIQKQHWWYAAAVLILVTGIVLYVSKGHQQKTTVAGSDQQVPADIVPGHDGAILTLADGSQLVLDSMNNGVIAKQNGAQVLLQNGSLAYTGSKQSAGATIYNTMSTPKGRQFQLVLPDGTHVWLNAASSITYPTAFAAKERKVTITGEAYFEVAHDVARPFYVSKGAMEVKVLGTHFNVNTYEEEPVASVTLLEGRVEVRSDVGSRKSEVGSRKSDVGSQKSEVGRQTSDLRPRTSDLRPQTSVFLKPGEQALTIDHSPLTINHSPNLDQVMAWKNGLFNFNGYDIKAVMREISRWYDIEVVYEGEPEPGELMGELQRNLTLAQVMKILQKIQVKYRIEGRKLIVTR